MLMVFMELFSHHPTTHNCLFLALNQHQFILHLHRSLIFNIWPEKAIKKAPPVGNAGFKNFPVLFMPKSDILIKR
jgi:hypothetical protein